MKFMDLVNLSMGHLRDHQLEHLSKAQVLQCIS